MGRPSKRAQFVHGMRAYSAHNRLHVNAPKLCRFAQSYIIGKDFCENGSGPPREPPPLGGADCDARWRTWTPFSQRGARAVNWFEPSDATERLAHRCPPVNGRRGRPRSSPQYGEHRTLPQASNIVLKLFERPWPIKVGFDKRNFLIKPYGGFRCRLQGGQKLSLRPKGGVGHGSCQPPRGKLGKGMSGSAGGISSGDPALWPPPAAAG
jgi:hypothetical protein